MTASNPEQDDPSAAANPTPRSRSAALLRGAARSSRPIALRAIAAHLCGVAIQAADVLLCSRHHCLACNFGGIVGRLSAGGLLSRCACHPHKPASHFKLAVFRIEAFEL